jgi:peroxiredoxin
MSQLTLLLGFARHELRQGWRSAEFWVVLVIAAIATAVPCAQSGTTAALAGYVAGNAAITVLGFLGMIWFSLAACRDVLTRTEPLILSKPSSGELIVIGRFLGNYGVVLLLMMGQLIAAALAQTLIAKTPFVPMAYWHAFQRSLVPLFFLGTLSYGLSLLFNTPITGLLAITYWVSVLAVRNSLRRVLNCSLGQNALIYILIGCAVLLLTAILFHPKRRGAKQFPIRWAAVTALLFLMGGLVGVYRANNAHDFPFRILPLADAMGSQHPTLGQRVPGFWLPDQRGRTARLEQHRNKILVIAVWSPAEPASPDALETLTRLRQKFPLDKVVPVAIGVHDDHVVPRHVALDSGFDFPAVSDVYARVTQPFDFGSPMASAYDGDNLPAVIVADRRHVVAYLQKGYALMHFDEVEGIVENLVREQY